MILEYKVSNFSSFNNEFDFSMKPGKVISRFQDNVIAINNNFKVSKLAVIVGENAGGKTSFMRSMDFFKYMINDSSGAYIQSIKKLCNNYNNKKPQSYELTLVGRNDKVYRYTLIIDDKSIVLEELAIRGLNYNKNNDKVIFRRDRTECKKVDNSEKVVDIAFNIFIDKNMISKELYKLLNEVLDKREYNHTGLFVNYLYSLGIDIVKPFVDSVNKNIIVEIPHRATIDVYKRMINNERDIEILKKDSYFEIFSLIDSSIVRIEVNDEQPFEKTVIVRQLQDGTEFKLEISNDSSGVNEFFAWAIQIWKVINEDAILFADEIDKVFNSILASKVVNYIKGSDHKGQFIFTTHNVLHMNTNDFMKEQIYFISKDIETLSSTLYSLGDFPDYRYEKVNVYELYLKGLLGGVPNA